MKKALALPFVIALVLLLLFACKKQNTNSCISLSVANVVVYSPVSFTDCGSGAISAAWDFGDGNNGSGIIVQHTYIAAGTYTVTLISTTTGGQTSTVTKTVVVYNAPSAQFSASQCGGTITSLISGDTTYFHAASGMASYQWNFGDGSTSASAAPWHIYNQTGSYSVSLKVTNPVASDSFAAVYTVNTPFNGFWTSVLTTISAGQCMLSNSTGSTAGSTFGIDYRWLGGSLEIGQTATITTAPNFIIASQPYSDAANSGTAHGHGTFLNYGTCNVEMILIDSLVSTSGTSVIADTLR